MTLASAPPQLPFAPRPIPAELFSSWLLRVAAANCVSLAELLDGLHSRYPEVPYVQSLDLCLPPVFLKALSAFCRVTVQKLQGLDLEQRLPDLQCALLLSFTNASWRCPRRRGQRLGYGFCRSCIAEQRTIHVPWDWCFACLIRCPVHGTSLLDSCPFCNEPDPLTFAAPHLLQSRVCYSCGGDLTDPAPKLGDGSASQQSIQMVQDAYRATLLRVAPDPALLGKVTAGAFRKFIDDMLQTLTQWLDPQLVQQNIRDEQISASSRQDLIRVVAELVSNAEPTSNDRQRRSAHARDLRLWGILFALIPESERASLERASLRWPLPLRRRFSSALFYHQRISWPQSPFRGSAFRPRFTYSMLPAVRDLSARNHSPTAESAI